VGGDIIDDNTKEVKAISYNYARTEERIFFDEELEGDYKVLKNGASEICNMT
jgi:hypothetical protein